MSHVTVVKFKLPVSTATGVAAGKPAAKSASAASLSTSPPDRSKRDEPSGLRSPVNSGMRGGGKATEQQQRQQQRIKQLEVIISQVARDRPALLYRAVFVTKICSAADQQRGKVQERIHLGSSGGGVQSRILVGRAVEPSDCRG